jgi:hypothetical protein
VVILAAVRPEGFVELNRDFMSPRADASLIAHRSSLIAHPPTPGDLAVICSPP